MVDKGYANWTWLEFKYRLSYNERKELTQWLSETLSTSEWQYLIFYDNTSYAIRISDKISAVAFKLKFGHLIENE